MEIKEIILFGWWLNRRKEYNMNNVEMNTFLCMISKLSSLDAINVADGFIRSASMTEEERKKLLDKLEEHKRFMLETIES